MRDILLSDTCVLLDFCEIGELSTLLHFRDRIVIAEDLLIAELPTWEAEIRQLGFRLDSLSSVEMQRDFLPMMARYQSSGLSCFDISVLTLAKLRKAALVTGERRLRLAAIEQKIPLKGTIFLLTEMVAQKVLSKEQACDFLVRMRQVGSRLPWDEARKQICIASKS